MITYKVVRVPGAYGWCVVVVESGVVVSTHLTEGEAHAEIARRIPRSTDPSWRSFPAQVAS